MSGFWKGSPSRPWLGPVDAADDVPAGDGPKIEDVPLWRGGPAPVAAPGVEPLPLDDLPAFRIRSRHVVPGLVPGAEIGQPAIEPLPISPGNFGPAMRRPTVNGDEFQRRLQALMQVLGRRRGGTF